MRDHAIVSPRFWTGETGRFLRDYPDAQRLAFYLMTCPNSNMIGLYYLPIPVICHELKSPLEGALEALRRVEQADFAAYDHENETVFVKKMAYYQVALSLAPRDNRIVGVQRLLMQHRNTIFFNDFIQEYKDAFCFDKAWLESVLKVDLGSPLEAPSKPLRSQDQEQDKEQDIIAAPPQTAKTKPPKKPKEPDPLFDSVAAITGADPTTAGSHIGRVCKLLRAAEPPYTPEEVLQLPELWKAAYTMPLGLGSIEKVIGWVRDPKRNPRLSAPARTSASVAAERARILAEEAAIDAKAVKPPPGLLTRKDDP